MAQTQTTRTFSGLIKEYMPYDMLREEVVKRDWFLTNSEIDTEFGGGTMYVPFMGAKASSVQYGVYAPEARIKQSQYVKGSITGYKELWGSLKFNDSDLQEHGNMEKSFLALLPEEIEQFSMHMKERASQAFLNGAWIASVTANSASATGIIAVDKPELLEDGMQVVVEEYVAGFPTVSESIGNAAATIPDGAAATLAFITAIDMNASTCQLVDENGTAIDLSTAGDELEIGPDALTDRPRIYPVNGENTDNQFESLRSSLLTVGNGGAATLYGQTKTAYSYLQALNFNGGSGGAYEVTSSNILDRIFDAQTRVQKVGKGNPMDILISPDNMKFVKRVLEVSRAYEKKDVKASPFGWQEITIGGPTKELTFVQINEIDNDILPIIDKRSWKIFSNGMFERRQDPDGKEYFTVRGANGFVYIVDIRFFAQLVWHAPSYNGILHGVDIA